MNVKLKRHLFLKHPQTTDIGPHTNRWSWNGCFPFHFLFGKIMTDMYLGAQEGDGHVGLGSVCTFGNCLTFFPNMEMCFSDFDMLRKGPLLRSLQRKLVVSSLCLTSSLFIVLVVLSSITAMLQLFCVSTGPCAYPPAFTPGYESYWNTFSQRLTSAPWGSFHPFILDDEQSVCVLNWVVIFKVFGTYFENPFKNCEYFKIEV